jgi:hypothetical protein
MLVRQDAGMDQGVDVVKMRIPADAIIPGEKITKYLLIPKSSGDKSKYLAAAGFTPATAAALESEIRRLIAEVDGIVERATQRGVYYNVIGTLAGPSGIARPVKLVWLKRQDGVFTFVTLIPHLPGVER